MGQAFACNLLIEVASSPNVIPIGMRAFQANLLTEVIIPANLTGIKLTIPSSIASINQWGFADNLINKVNIVDGVLDINDNSGIFDLKPITSNIGVCWRFDKTS